MREDDGQLFNTLALPLLAISPTPDLLELYRKRFFLDWRIHGDVDKVPLPVRGIGFPGFNHWADVAMLDALIHDLLTI
jgi:hypothetical protein